MKRWLWCLAALALAAVMGWMPFTGTDVGKLQPVEVIRVSMQGDLILVETDTGDVGMGADLDTAFADLKESTAGEIFLDTADYLLITRDAQGQLAELSEYLRPACAVCLEAGEAELEEAAAFLSAHDPELTLGAWRAGEQSLPSLVSREGRMYLVS